MMSSASSSFGHRAVAAGAVAAAASLWLCLLVLSPYWLSGTPTSGVRFRAAAFVYQAGALVCHQRPDRSFHAWGVQLPVCARCFGLYLSAAAGAAWAAIAALQRRDQSRIDWTLRAWRRALAVVAVPTGLSVGLEVAAIWPQTSLVRAVAALPAGFVVGWFIASHAAPRPTTTDQDQGPGRTTRTRTNDERRV